MPDPSPVWQDEAFAGTLFPAARPIPAKWIANDYQALTTVEDFRVEQSARAAQRDAARAQEQSPEAQEVAWRQAHEQARLEMRRERQQGRVAAGIEPAAAPCEYAASLTYADYCESFVQDIAGGMRPALQQMAQALASLSQSVSSVVNIIPGAWASFNGAPPAHLQEQVVSAEEWVAAVANGGWFPPSGHADALKRAVRNMDALSAPAPTRKPAPQYRERYLPGTRHARRGR